MFMPDALVKPAVLEASESSAPSSSSFSLVAMASVADSDSADSSVSPMTPPLRYTLKLSVLHGPALGPLQDDVGNSILVWFGSGSF